MSLLPIVGHEPLRARLRDAAAAGRFPQSLLLHGPAGVGKQRLALWSAALLQCEGDDRPCDRCRPCRLATRLEHPDIHWHFPLTRPRNDDRLRARLEESRQEELAARRAEPLRVPADEVSAIYLAAVEEMRHAASRRPAVGRCAVFVVGEADRMVAQASSPEAANAFLKLLEEPPSDTFVLLTSSRPAALLPTVRSRVLETRVPPLREGEVEAFLRDHAGVDVVEARRLAALSAGSIGRALRLAAESEEEEARVRGSTLLAAALSGRASDRLRVALALGARGARGPFRTALEELTGLLRDLLEATARGEDPPGELRGSVGAGRLSLGQVLEASRLVDEASAEALGNVNPQAITAVLLTDLARVLDGNPPVRGGY